MSKKNEFDICLLYLYEKDVNVLCFLPESYSKEEAVKIYNSWVKQNDMDIANGKECKKVKEITIDDIEEGYASTKRDYYGFLSCLNFCLSSKENKTSFKVWMKEFDDGVLYDNR